MKYFIGNWKMFGVPKSINILNKINSYYSKDKNRNKYRVIITPPYTLIDSYSKNFKNKRILIGAQNCYQKEQFSSNTAAISPFMLKSVGAKYTLVGHSDNRQEGDTDVMLKEKVRYAIKNNLKVWHLVLPIILIISAFSTTFFFAVLFIFLFILIASATLNNSSAGYVKPKFYITGNKVGKMGGCYNERISKNGNSYSQYY